MAYMFMGYIVKAFMVIICVVMAYIVRAYIVMICVGMAYVIMVYIVMAPVYPCVYTSLARMSAHMSA